MVGNAPSPGQERAQTEAGEDEGVVGLANLVGDALVNDGGERAPGGDVGKQTDAKILQAIEEALWRIEKGTYGMCRDCGEPIAPARLNAIPWTRVCITCKEKQNS